MEGERVAGIEIDLLGGIQLFLTPPFSHPSLDREEKTAIGRPPVSGINVNTRPGRERGFFGLHRAEAAEEE